jgi:hypothetical protein
MNTVRRARSRKKKKSLDFDHTLRLSRLHLIRRALAHAVGTSELLAHHAAYIYLKNITFRFKFAPLHAADKILMYSLPLLEKIL